MCSTDVICAELKYVLVLNMCRIEMCVYSDICVRSDLVCVNSGIYYYVNSDTCVNSDVMCSRAAICVSCSTVCQRSAGIQP